MSKHATPSDLETPAALQAPEALIALVHLLARQAAAEVLAAGEQTDVAKAALSSETPA